MTTSSRNLPALLQAGITAVQHGELERGRDLLLQVTAQDEQNVEAWWWLSQAMEDPADIQVALENVLALDPAHKAAQQRLKQLSAPADAWQSKLAPAGVEPDDGIDDPLQCVACGKPTRLEDRQCPHCRRDLYVKLRPSQDSHYLQTGLIVLAIHAGLALAQAGLAGMAWDFAREGETGGLGVIEGIPLVPLLIGQVFHIPAGAAALLALGLGVRLMILAGLWLGLQQRWAIAFYGALLALPLDVLVSGALAFNGGLGVITAVLNAGLALAGLYLVGASYQEFAVTWQRLETVPDTTVHTAGGYQHLAQQYSRAGLWALSVAQWRRAVGLAPKEAAFYKQLGIAYAHIERYERSIKALEEAARRAPQDRDLPEIIALVKKQAAGVNRRR